MILKRKSAIMKEKWQQVDCLTVFRKWVLDEFSWRRRMVECRYWGQITHTHTLQNKLEPTLIHSLAFPPSLCFSPKTHTHTQWSGWNQRVLAVRCSVPPVVSQHSPQLYDYTGVWQKHNVRDHRGVEYGHVCVWAGQKKMNMHVWLDEFSMFLRLQLHYRSVCFSEYVSAPIPLIHPSDSAVLCPFPPALSQFKISTITPHPHQSVRLHSCL